MGTCAYTVAGWSFRLSMPDGSPLWKTLSAYGPFITENAGTVLFTLEVLTEPWELKGSAALLDENSDEDMPRIDIYRTENGGWQFRMSVNHRAELCCVMEADRGLEKAQAYVSGPASSMAYGINNSLMLLYALRTADRNTLEMHASVIMRRGKAFLFTAKSGTGKSTHSSLWLKHIEGSELMNDDNPVVRIHEDGRVMAYGSPWSGKTRCYKNVSAEVGAVVKIRRSDTNRITRLNVPNSYASLYSSSSGFKSDRKMADGLHSSISHIALSVPCYVLDCRPDKEAATVCAAELLKDETENFGDERKDSETSGQS